MPEFNHPEYGTPEVPRYEAPERYEPPPVERPEVETPTFERQDVFFNELQTPEYGYYTPDLAPYLGYGAPVEFGGVPYAYSAPTYTSGMEAPAFASSFGTPTPAEELSLWEKFKGHLANQFTTQNMGRGLATSALLNLATGGTATPLQLLGGLAAGGIAGAGGATAAGELPSEYRGLQGTTGSAVAGGIGSLLYGQNPLLGAAVGGVGRLAGDVTKEAVGGPTGDLLAGAVSGAARAGVAGGDTSEGASRGLYEATIANSLQGNRPAGGSPFGGAGGAGNSDLQTLALLARGVYGMREASNLRRAGEEAARMADPWAASGGRALASGQLQDIMRDPTAAMATDPGFKARLQAAQRGAAIYGADSGAMAIAAANAGGDWYNQRLMQLGNLAGAGANPAAAAQLQLEARQRATDQASRSLATLGYGFAGA